MKMGQQVEKFNSQKTVMNYYNNFSAYSIVTNISQ